jgi:hypothetical protein
MSKISERLGGLEAGKFGGSEDEMSVNIKVSHLPGLPVS